MVLNNTGRSGIGIVPSRTMFALAGLADASNPTDQECARAQCGLDPSMGLPCSIAGKAGNHTCGDPVCAAYQAEMVAAGLCPQPRPASAVVAPQPGQVQVPARNIGLPMTPATPETVTTGSAIAPPSRPRIVTGTCAPSIIATANNSARIADEANGGPGGLTAWLADNPVLASLGILAVAFAVFGGGGGSRGN